MRIDWSAATVVPESGRFTLRVVLLDVLGAAYEEAFETAGTRIGDPPRHIYRSMSGMDWIIDLWPIDPNDIAGERRLLDEFAERVTRIAEPDQARRDEEQRRKQAEADAREQQARDLAERFRQT